MAKIEMDISEYEAMKENKKLLEDSLKQERELREQIKQLTDEKTKALEDAKMKVVKITRSETTEHLLRKKTDKNYMFHQIFYLMGINYHSLPTLPDNIHTDHLIDIFFEKTTSFTQPTEEIRTCGLDEIKMELREEIDSETKHKIKVADKAILQNSELTKVNVSLRKENDDLKKLNEDIIKKSEEIQDKNKELESKSEKFHKIEELIKEGYGLFNKKNLLDKIANQFTN